MHLLIAHKQFFISMKIWKITIQQNKENKNLNSRG